jgi:Zn-dependent protease
MIRPAMPFEHDSPFAQLLRWLSRDFRIGRFLGVEVRMYWVAAILTPLLTLQGLARFTGGFLELLLLTGFMSASLFVTVWTHEMGHIAMGWRYGIRTPLITLSPLGGVAHMGSGATSPRRELAISLAGPAVHLAWLAICWPLARLVPYGTLTIDGFAHDPLWFALQVLFETNRWLLLFNLLPLFPMDGGRALRALIALRLHPNRATMIATAIGLAGNIGLALWGFVQPDYQGTILALIGITNVLSCLQERRVARHTLIYAPALGDHREIWQSDPEAWRRGAHPFGTSTAQRHPGVFARWRASRAEARRERERREQLQRERDVDRVLERVHQVGMAGLTDAEKQILRRAAERRRGAG